MQLSLVNFLNHGLLPFVGRSVEIDRIESFWRETSDAPGLRALLLLGEAGIGKSRLLEEAAARITSSGGVVVHTKLYSDSATSVIPLMARALGRSGVAQQLLKSEPEETLPGVSSALTRICGLRPTLMIVEDLHLLSGDAVAELATLLDRLSDEPLSLLCSARPAEIAARSVMELYLVDEIMLEGIPTEDIETLCRSLLGDDFDARMVRMLRQKTFGNAMAIRSALRGALKPISQGGGKGTPARTMIDRRSFVDALERNVRLLSEGMVAHLNDEEKRAAGTLGCLGEVFARETATAMLENAEDMLDRLTFKGIIHTSPTAPNPLNGSGSASLPLAFTHNLLHRHLIERTPVDANALLAALAADLPIYSIHPFTLLAEHSDALTAPKETALAVIRRCPTISSQLDMGPDWKLAATVWNTVQAIFERYRDEWEGTERLEIEVRLLSGEIQVRRRDSDVEAHRKIASRLIELTADESEALLEYRLGAVKSLYWNDHRDSGSQTPEHLLQLRDMIARYPWLKLTRTYVLHLREHIIIASDEHDGRDAIRHVEENLREILDSPDADPALKEFAFDKIGPYLLHAFDTEQELQERMEMLTVLDERSRDRNMYLLFCKIQFLEAIGRIDGMLETIATAMPRFRERGLWRYEITATMWRFFGQIVLDGDSVSPPRIVEELTRELRQAGEHPFATDLAAKLVEAAVIACDYEGARRISTDMPLIPKRLAPMVALFALPDEQGTAPLDALPYRNDTEATIRDLISIDPETADAAEQRRAIERATELLRAPILRTSDLLPIRIVLDRFGELKDAGSPLISVAQEKAASDVVDRSLRWLSERRLSTIMERTSSAYGTWLKKNDLTAWRSRTTAIARERGTETANDDESRIRITMFGAISVQHPATEPARIRGAQLCSLLGLMTANLILARPLSTREFNSLAIGLERDPDKLRKSLNFAVFRLREAIGSDSVDTTGETPALNLSVVSVDLVDAHRHLHAAAEAISDGALLRAVPELLAALRISRGQVPFPTLYDEFFESAREDFENELRSTIIRAARALLRQEDAATAEELLDLAFSAMPDDEEIAEMLRSALTSLGKRTEATRVGMRVAEAMDE